MKRFEFEANEEFITNQADGAFLNGTTVYKTNSEPGDLVINGTKGKVIGSIAHTYFLNGRLCKYGYFIKWDCLDQIAAIVDYRIRVDKN